MKVRESQRFDLVLISTALLAAFLNIYKIWTDQYANSYYTAAVTSMLQNFHNFFYASFDPGGYVTVDKPPVVFWIQTLFAYIFGVHGWSVILPQALAGVGSVLLIYYIVKPTFGKAAARLASLVMACTPIAVAVSRTNNIDSMLVFTLLLAVWLLFRGIRYDKPVCILGAFAMIGVGFNMKMLQAYMVVPAFYLFYLLAFKSTWKKKLAVLSAATVILTGVSLSWALVVDNVAQDSRPYIGSSKTNSVLELAFGYNGMSRLTGMNRGGGPGGNGSSDQKQQNGFNVPNQLPAQNGDNASSQPMRQGAGRPDGSHPDSNRGPGPTPGGGGGPQGQRGGMFGTGSAGPLRLFQSELSAQISWLLPFVAFAAVGLLAGLRFRKQMEDKQKETLFWLAWLLPAMAFFSIAGFFHQYYLIMLAPPIAALAGAGWAELWQLYRDRAGWKMWLLPSGLLAATAFQLYILYPYQKQIGIYWSIGIGAAGAVLSLILLLAAGKEKLSGITAIAGLLVLLAAPLYWATTPLLYGVNDVMPQAGPSRQAGAGGPRQIGGAPGQMGGDFGSGVNEKLLEYVTKHNTGETYLFAVTDSHSAAPYIIETGKAVMAMGGFSGGDSILTVEKLKKMVADKKVKYFLISSGSGGRGGSSEVTEWIRANSVEVPKDAWQMNANSSQDQGGPMRNGSETLYQISLES
ncbi:glycosyl transferase family 39 [Desulfofarcimen acetoxidans DSM 771]|uniref:Glycosyl transferase family 39 n=1 Tax=Desulfofarcimen acetoxidans (strain ATCC 49208 / DSM 771 / KCTC 5769 / VKM B-1644 / 5575) TaxID=485916 RepID=C8W007_DESAS|nr:glycosyltransferase family 39 protein [Desulfofarcimen acetoxidans]ACV64975.1 glycosyl transferase family 39 [Desulfofarcimen acetoxidans DSM 771]